MQWNLSSGAYPQSLRSEIEEAILRIKTLSYSLAEYSGLIGRSMDERRQILSQTQSLHAQIMQYKAANYQLRRQLNQIGVLAVEAAQSSVTDATGQESAEPAPQNSGSRSESPAAGNQQSEKLFLRIHFEDGAVGPEDFPYSWLKTGVKKDKQGNGAKAVLCPNCEAVFIDKGIGVKDCGIQSHLTKFKCPRLKHLRPESGTENQPAKKKRKQSPIATEEPEIRVDDEVSVNDELQDLVQQIGQKEDSSNNSSNAHTPEPSDNASSVHNIAAVSGMGDIFP